MWLPGPSIAFPEARRIALDPYVAHPFTVHLSPALFPPRRCPSRSFSLNHFVQYNEPVPCAYPICFIVIRFSHYSALDGIIIQLDLIPCFSSLDPLSFCFLLCPNRMDNSCRAVLCGIGMRIGRPGGRIYAGTDIRRWKSAGLERMSTGPGVRRGYVQPIRSDETPNTSRTRKSKRSMGHDGQPNVKPYDFARAAISH